MFSVQKLLSKDEQFYELLEASASEARKSVQALNRILSAPKNVPKLEEFHQSKQAEKEITERISEALVSTFVTELEREDIEMLSAALYKIPKNVEKFAQRFIISSEMVKDTDFSRHIKLLEAATDQVLEMVKMVRRVPSIDKIKEMNSALQKVEGDADKLILDMYKDLYSGKHDPMKVLAMKDLYELLEKMIDRCRDAGNVVTHIVLKHA